MQARRRILETRSAVILIGALAIIRFRNILKDTRDTAFIFAALVVGMGAGSQRFGEAIVGTLVIGLVTAYLHLTRFGTRESYDGFLRFRYDGPRSREDLVSRILDAHCRSLSLVSLRRSDEDPRAEYAYEVWLRDRGRDAELLGDLGAVAGVGASWSSPRAIKRANTRYSEPISGWTAPRESASIALEMA